MSQVKAQCGKVHMGRVSYHYPGRQAVDICHHAASQKHHFVSIKFINNRLRNYTKKALRDAFPGSGWLLPLLSNISPSGEKSDNP